MSLNLEEELRAALMEVVAPLWGTIKLQSEQIYALTSQVAQLASQLANTNQLSCEEADNIFPLSPSAEITENYSKGVQWRRPVAHIRTPPDTTPIHLQNRYLALAVYSDLHVEVQQWREKAKNAIIMNFPEKGKGEGEEDDDEDVTIENDFSTIRSVFAQANISFEGVWVARCGMKRNDRPRILKVFTPSESRRDQFMASFNRNKPVGAERSFCRRDLTPTELKIDSLARREAFKRNIQTGERQWTVRNLELVKLPGPNYYPFPPSSAPMNANRKQQTFKF